ncbi:MAG: hypothetical protein MI747_13895 [Desulfobacterales bacterium]|nr:hypothetical protein [Desulfobacterales bacterium]
MSLSREDKKRIYQEEKLRHSLRGKSMAMALILSALVPGLGDLYCGSWFKALVFFALDLVLILLFVFTLGFSSFLFFPFWICGLVSAYFSVDKSQVRVLDRLGRDLGD